MALSYESKHHILVVDDDKRIRELLKRYLVQNGFFVSIASSAATAMDEVNKFIFSILVIDLMMPNESGAELLKKIRQDDKKTPVIMLTAVNSIENKIDCFEGGCNDYLTKPFEPKELILRINNLLNKEPSDKHVCQFGEYIFDFDKEILTKNDEVIHLTESEILVLSILCKNVGKALTRSELVPSDFAERSIDVTITRIRKKIEKDPQNPLLLRTIRGIGYRLG